MDFLGPIIDPKAFLKIIFGKNTENFASNIRVYRKHERIDIKHSFLILFSISQDKTVEHTISLKI